MTTSKLYDKYVHFDSILRQFFKAPADFLTVLAYSAHINSYDALVIIPNYLVGTLSHNLRGEHRAERMNYLK